MSAFSLNPFDKRVVATEQFKNSKYFTVCVRRLHTHKTEKDHYVLFDVVPLYTISTENKKLVKTKLMNYDHIHFLLVLGEPGEQIKRRWMRSKNKRKFLVSFVRDHFYRTSYFSKTQKKEFTCVVLVCKGIVMICNNVIKEQIEQDDPPCKVPLDEVQIPTSNLNIIKQRIKVTVVEADTIYPELVSDKYIWKSFPPPTDLRDLIEKRRKEEMEKKYNDLFRKFDDDLDVSLTDLDPSEFFADISKWGSASVSKVHSESKEIDSTDSSGIVITDTFPVVRCHRNWERLRGCEICDRGFLKWYSKQRGWVTSRNNNTKSNISS